MSDDEAAFLRTIRANPDADLPRLVYADYLEEQGHQFRAQFLRAHLELERLTEDSPRRRELAFWCRTQLDTQSHLLFEPPFQPKFARHGRGLIEAAEFWNASDGEIASAFHLAPLRRVWVYGLDRWLTQLKRVPVDNCLHTLDLTGNRLTADALRSLAQVMRFPHLKELVLTGCDLDDEAMGVLCERPPFRDLEMIRVGANPFGEACREGMRGQFGERISFNSIDSRDPARLYCIQGDQLDAGFGYELTQILGAASHDGYQIAIFDYAGNVIDFRAMFPLERESVHEKLKSVLESLGYRSGTIRVKEFGWPSGRGLSTYPTSQLHVLNNLGGDHTVEELAAGRAWLENWLRDGCFKLAWGTYADVWLNAGGEICNP